MSVALVGVTFPVDLSGGVTRFRHRRGVLEHLTLRMNRERARAALAPRLRGILDETAPSLTLAAMDGGILVGMTTGAVALAFDLYWAPTGQDLRWVIGNVRSIGLRTPALAAATHAVDALLGRFGERHGVLATVPQAARLVAREVLPSLGARTPDTQQVAWGPLEADAAGWRMVCDSAFAPPVIPKHVVTELELARMTGDADDALAAGDLDEARHGYASLLERAPRDVDLARRIADVDRAVGGRAHAALATIAEFMPMVEAGPLGAELLALTGSPVEAARTFEQAADREPFAPLAALGFLSAAELAPKRADRSRLLDAAVARAPALAAPRWQRLTLRLQLGEVAGALADAEHLEAASRGAHARHQVWARAAETFLVHRQAAKAVTLFEKALRYLPDDPRAVAGLARGLLAAGRAGRALDLLARAVDLAERLRVAAHDVTLLLARALADTAGDLTHAIARVRAIPAGERESVEARALEARWRAALGDVAGASVAFAAMRDAIEAHEPVDRKPVVGWLLEAAEVERNHGDLRSSQGHLALALRLSGGDLAVRRKFREVNLELATRREPAELRHEGDADGDAAADADADAAADGDGDADADADGDGNADADGDGNADADGDGNADADEAQRGDRGRGDADADGGDEGLAGQGELDDVALGGEADAPSWQDEQRAKLLEERLRADPRDERTVVELCEVLQRLGRDIDLFAVLSAQLEDADAEWCARLLPLQRAVLERLRLEALRRGHGDEAKLYADALVTVGSAGPKP